MYRVLSDMACKAPLICFENVKMHLSDQVLSHFGLTQHIPDTVEQVTRITRASKLEYDWRQELSTYISR